VNIVLESFQEYGTNRINLWRWVFRTGELWTLWQRQTSTHAGNQRPDILLIDL